MLTRVAAIVFVFVTLIALALPACAGVTLPRLRYSTAPDKVRVVLDLPAETAATTEYAELTVTVRVNTPLPEALPGISLDDPLVTGITVTPDTGGNAVLTIRLAKPRKCSVFTLPAEGDKPFRVVVDVLKCFKEITQRAITPAIQYTRLEEQTDDAYHVVHFLDVDTRDPNVHLGVTAAQEVRERVAAMVTRTGAVAGVNGGYFVDGTRPVGLLKVDGQVRALPIWQRTAAAFPSAGPPIFDNPTGYWRLLFNNGTIHDIPDHLDASAHPPAPTAEIFAGQTYTTAPANPHGLTVIIQDHVVTARTTTSVSLATDEFALALHGTDVDELGSLLWEGAVVLIQPVIQPSWSEHPAAVGAGPRLLHEGKIAISADTERFKPDISTGHPARTALGVTADGHVIFIAVEAPCICGGGATLEELATLLQARGAVEAMNFDGGGSTQLALGAQTVNCPPDTWVRPVACGILVYDTRVKVSKKP